MIKSPGIKAKGLFCCFPAEHVFSFAVHGLYVQSLPNGANHSLEAQDRIFGTPWVFANPTPLLPLSEELASTYSITGTASKLAKRFGSGPLLRFCKLSTISSVAMFSEEVREKGVFLSLCRVLIDRPKTIAGHIEDVDIVDAMREGYDAVYSSLR